MPRGAPFFFRQFEDTTNVVVSLFVLFCLFLRFRQVSFNFSCLREGYIAVSVVILQKCFGEEDVFSFR